MSAEAIINRIWRASLDTSDVGPNIRASPYSLSRSSDAIAERVERLIGEYLARQAGRDPGLGINRARFGLGQHVARVVLLFRRAGHAITSLSAGVRAFGLAAVHAMK